MRPQSQILFAGMFLTAATLLTAAAPASLHAQNPTSLTTADSAQVYVTALRVLLDTLASKTPADTRVWLRFRAVSPDARPSQQIEVSDAQWSDITRAFPESRHAAETDTLFLCPPGVQVRMPGSGCPIRDGGIIVEFRNLSVDADTVTLFGMLIQSSNGAVGMMTWAQGLVVVLERDGDEWRLRETKGRFITRAPVGDLPQRYVAAAAMPSHAAPDSAVARDA